MILILQKQPSAQGIEYQTETNNCRLRLVLESHAMFIVLILDFIEIIKL